MHLDKSKGNLLHPGSDGLPRLKRSFCNQTSAAIIFQITPQLRLVISYSKYIFTYIYTHTHASMLHPGPSIRCSGQLISMELQHQPIILEKCFLGHMGFLVAVPRVANGRGEKIAAHHIAIACNTSMVVPQVALTKRSDWTRAFPWVLTCMLTALNCTHHLVNITGPTVTSDPRLMFGYLASWFSGCR